jgi:DNA modification methylase
VGWPEYLLLFRKLPTDTTKAYADIPVVHSKKEYSRGRWQIDARAKWNSSGNRLLTSEEIEHGDLQFVNELFTERAAYTVYDYQDHLAAAEGMEKRGKLPATFETFRVPARSPWVWHDVLRMRTLNGEQARRNLEKHVCPLQLDIVERVIERFSNPGDVVFDMFAGIFTVPYCAVKMGRFGIGTELNISYWHDGCNYLRQAEENLNAPTLF